MMVVSVPKLSAYSGLMAGEKDLRMVSTKWFKIIFPESSAESAKKIYDQADQIYEEICLSYNTTPQFPLTITITPATQVFNAYYSNYSSNHIVLYDTVPDQDLMVFDDSILGTFKHELTHAVSCNVRNKFWRNFDAIFGDVYNFGYYVTLTSFFKEGASIFQESLDGQGRLNNGFYLHPARQSLIQKSFPSYADVTGARDIYPGGSLSYWYGGIFTEYLINRFGNEKYADFWWKGINGGAITYEGLFKKVYGKNLDSVWKEFQEDFFSGIEILDCKPKNDFGSRGQIFSSLCVNGKGISYINKTTDDIFFMPVTENGIGKIKKLFNLTNVQNISLSNDGRFLVCDYVDTNYANYKKSCLVYDFRSGKKTKVQELGLSQGRIFSKNNETYFTAVGTKNNDSFLGIWKISFDKKENIKSLDFVKKFELGCDQNIFDPVDLGEGRIAFLHWEGGSYGLCISDVFSDEEITRFVFEKNLSVRNLSLVKSSKDELILDFSWATKDTFPRLGTFVLKDGSARVSFMNQDISGGIYNPVEHPALDKIFYIGNFVDETSILSMDKSFVDWESKSLSSEKISLENEESGDSKSAYIIEDFLSTTKKYHGGFSRGSLFPFASVNLYDQNAIKKSSIAFPGLTYICSDPWDGVNLLLSAGVNPGGVFFSFFQDDCFEAGLGMQLSGGTSTNLFNYSLSTNLVFDEKGFAQTSFESILSSYIKSGVLGFSVKNSMDLLYGRECGKSCENTFSFSDVLIFALSSVKKTGPGYFQKLQFIANLVGEMEYMLGENLDCRFYPAMKIGVPNLLPFDCTKNFTYNLPLTFTGTLASTRNQILTANVSAVIFDWEIQKGTKFVPIYFNRFYTNLTYSCALFDASWDVSIFNVWEKMGHLSDYIFADSLRWGFYLDGTLNTGSMANPSGMATFALELIYSPRLKDGKQFSMSGNISLNF